MPSRAEAERPGWQPEASCSIQNLHAQDTRTPRKVLSKPSWRRNSVSGSGLKVPAKAWAPKHQKYTTWSTYFLAKGRNWRIIKFWHSNYPIPFTFNSDHPCLDQVKPDDLQLPQKFSCICSWTFCSSRFTSAAARYFTSSWKETSSPGICEVPSVPTSREHLECNNV